MTSSYIVLALVAIAVNIAYCCDYPNGTEFAMHWWDCGNGDVKIYDATPLDADGNYVYPVYLYKRTLVAMEIDNQGPEYTANDDLILDIKVYQYEGWSGCKWSEIPTFGLLANRPACSHGVICPIPPGQQTQTVWIDFDHYTTITGLLKTDAPYQLEYVVTNKATGRKACITFQARAYTTP